MIKFIIYLFAFFGYTLVDSSSATCPRGWQHDIVDRSCYYMSKRRMTHAQATEFCHKMDNSSHLLRVECDGENDFIKALLKKQSTTWIDARARFDIVDSEAGLFSPGFVFRWPNGKIVRFSNWSTGHGISQIDRSHKCIQMTSSGEWKNAVCTQLSTTVCEKKLHRHYDKQCPKHWTYFPSTSSCYRAVTRTNMTILDADNRCFQMGYEHNQDAMLASVGSEEENDFILQMVKDKKPSFDWVFLGGFGRSNNGSKWHWMDGLPFTYSNWDRGMPYGRRALAVLVMNRRGRWINHYADRILSQFNSIAMCKFRVSQ